MAVRVIVVRHGERLDESDAQLWRGLRTQETLYDPPLTAKGWDQAQAAGREIAKMLPEDCQLTMYSSPTARTISTAAGLATSLSRGITTITPCYSLNCCAAAQSRGVAKAFPKKEPEEVTTGGFPLAFWPPLGDAAQIDRRQRSGGGFVESVKEIAANHHDGEVIVMVSHREGIWELHRHVGTRGSNGYCNTNFFTYDLSRNRLAAWDPASSPSRTNATVQERGARCGCFATKKKECSPGKERPTTSTLPASSTEESHLGNLEALLASASGIVMVHRGGKGGGSTLLWRTPGVRGVWADGGGIPDGELVSLLSSPQSSEGNEGDFVLVQRATGHEGWLKLKNVRLP